MISLLNIKGLMDSVTHRSIFYLGLGNDTSANFWSLVALTKIGLIETAYTIAPTEFTVYYKIKYEL